MSSGERAKPPGTYEERNPFDISRRSQNEIATEIAKRMAAWKQARGRSYAAPSAPPSGEAKAPPISAPVQPTRLPKFGEHARAPQSATLPESRPAKTPEPKAPQAKATQPKAPQARKPAPPAAPASAKPTRADDRSAPQSAPLFATSSAVRRAMPPAPSLKRPASTVAPSVETPSVEAPQIVDAPQIETFEVASRQPPALEPAPATAESPAETATAAANDGAAEIQGIEAPVDEPSSAEAVAPAIPTAETSEATDESEGDEIASREIDASAAPMSSAHMPEAEHVPEAAHAALEVTAPDGEAHPTDVPEIDVPTMEAPAEKRPEAELPAHGTPEIALPDRDAQRIETPEAETPGIQTSSIEAAAVAMRETERTISAALAAKAREIKARWMKARDEEPPRFGAPIAGSRDPELVARSRPSVDAAHIEGHGVDVDVPHIDASAAEPAVPAAPAAAVKASEIDERVMVAPTAESHEIGRGEPAVPDIEARRFDEGERREPTFDRPIAKKREVEVAVPTAPAAEAPAAAARSDQRRIALPSIETRIEARRFQTLRADPPMVARRPIFPRIDPEEWDVPPAVAARANRQPLRGTGWAIALGTVLLIIGVTAPAAIWQHGPRQAPTDQDQVAILNPTDTSAPKPEAGSAVSETPLAVPGARQAPNAPVPPVQPQGGQPQGGQSAPVDEASLSAVRDGGEVSEAPISRPPAPTLDLASKSAIQTDTAAGETPFMVARPFVPDQQPAPAPFLRAPTSAAAPFTAAPASIALRPSLMAQLKPEVTSAPAAKPAATRPQKVVRKPRNNPLLDNPVLGPVPQQLDQMFETLVRTLSNGQPSNPANQPPPPSNRK